MSKVYNGQFPAIFRLLLCGSSMSGKTSIAYEIIANKYGILEKKFERLIYLRGIETEQEIFLRNYFGSNMIVYDGIPDEQELLPILQNNDKNTLLLIEDLDVNAFNSPFISRIYKVLSHHLKFSIITTTQNCFSSGKEKLTLIRNSTHILIFGNDLDHSIIRSLASRLYPEKPKAFINLFKDVTSKEPYSYLSVFSNCNRDLQFRSHLTQPVQKIYMLY